MVDLFLAAFRAALDRTINVTKKRKKYGAIMDELKQRIVQLIDEINVCIF